MNKQRHPLKSKLRKPEIQYLLSSICGSNFQLRVSLTRNYVFKEQLDLKQNWLILDNVVLELTLLNCNGLQRFLSVCRIRV